MPKRGGPSKLRTEKEFASTAREAGERIKRVGQGQLERMKKEGRIH